MSETTLETAVTTDRTRPFGGHRRWLVGVACAFILVVVAFAILGSLITPKDPTAQNLGTGVLTPGSEYWLGTDTLGRDVFSRMVAGARSAIIGPVLIALGAAVIGNLFGVMAGYLGGRLDSLLMRLVDLLYALPALLVAVVVVGVLGGGYVLAVLILIVLFAPYDTRLVRGVTLAQRGLPYVEAVRALGVSRRRIMFRHIWPNLLPIVIANTFVNFAYALVALSGLTYLGLGAGAGSPDWGRTLSDAQSIIFENPAAALAPGIMLVLTAVSMSVIGDWLSEQISKSGHGLR